MLVSGGFFLADQARGLQSIHDRHFHIHEDQIELGVLKLL